MAFAQARFLAFYNRNQGISLPDMAPLANVVFILICFYMVAGRLKAAENTLVPLERKPASTWIPGCTLYESSTQRVTIGLNQLGQYSFAADSALQLEVIQQVLQQHGVKLTHGQFAALRNQPHLVTDVRQLPEWLTLPNWQQQQRALTKQYHTLTAEQLGECIMLIQALREKQKLIVLFRLSIEAETKIGQVRCLTDILQANGINRFDLLTQVKQ